LISGGRIESAWILQDQHYMCALLHPSLKHFHITPNEHAKALELIKQELLKRTPAPTLDSTNVLKATTTSITYDTSRPVNAKNLLIRCFDQTQSIIKPVPTPVTELDNYMALDVQIHDNDDVLIFWEEHEILFPTLASIVRDLFAIPASNTLVERLFSSSKNTVTDRRTSLGGEKINKLLFLQKNLLTLQKINEEKSKRRLSTSDDESILLVQNGDNLSSSTNKRTKPNDSDSDCDYSLNDIEDIIDDSVEPGEILFDI